LSRKGFKVNTSDWRTFVKFSVITDDVFKCRNAEDKEKSAATEISTTETIELNDRK